MQLWTAPQLLFKCPEGVAGQAVGLVSCRNRCLSSCYANPVDTNPYQSPQTDCYACENRQELHLVVSANTVLPSICIKTNQPVSQADMIRGEFYWCSPWVAILALGGPLVIPAFFLLRKRITITYGLTPELRRKWRIWRIAKIGMIGITFVTPVLALAVIFAIGSLAWPVGPGLIGALMIVALDVSFIALLVSIFIGNPPLTAVKHRHGLFWVKGCSAAYLARMEAEKEVLNEPSP